MNQPRVFAMQWMQLGCAHRVTWLRWPAYVYAKCITATAKTCFCTSVAQSISRVTTPFEISDYLPGHVSDLIHREIAASDSILYTEVLLWTVINRPKSWIWVNVRNFFKNSIPPSPRSKPSGATQCDLGTAWPLPKSQKRGSISRNVCGQNIPRNIENRGVQVGSGKGTEKTWEEKFSEPSRYLRAGERAHRWEKIPSSIVVQLSLNGKLPNGVGWFSKAELNVFERQALSDSGHFLSVQDRPFQWRSRQDFLHYGMEEI